MKDAQGERYAPVSCQEALLAGDFRMGKPSLVHPRRLTLQVSGTCFGILKCEGEPPELKHLSRERKRNQRDCLSSGERNGKSPNPTVGLARWLGVVGAQCGSYQANRTIWNG
jgi:hypothetical protein